MAQSSPQPHVAFDDFVAAERDSDTRHEWLDGIVYAMAGGTIEHGRLAANILAGLRTTLPRACQVYSSDVLVYVRETRLATYPDCSVVCGKPEVEQVVRGGKVLGEALTNPTIVVEVLSDSTESYDRGEKFAHYMRLPSLEAYVVVSQAARRVEIFRPPSDKGHWSCENVVSGASFTLGGEALSVDDIYG